MNSSNTNIPKMCMKDRITFGERATLRRKQLNLSASYVSLRLGIANAAFRLWEKTIPQRPRIEEREWEKILEVPVGWLRDPAIETPVPSNKMEMENYPSINTETIAAEIRLVGVWLARKLLPQRTLLITDLNNDEIRRAEIFALRYGVLGEDNTTLAQIGETYGLARERIRQIVEKLTERATYLKLSHSKLEAIAEEMKRHLPCSVIELDQKFKEVLGENLSVLSMDRFSREIYGKGLLNFSERPASTGKASLIAVIDNASHDHEAIKAVREASLKMIRSCGAAHIGFVSGMAGGLINRGITLDQTIQYVKLLNSFEWIDEQDG